MLPAAYVPPACHGVPTLLVEKFSGTEAPESGTLRVTTDGDGHGVVLHLGGDAHVLDGEEARALRAALDDALHRVTEFTHTTGEHRPDGSYVVSRRRASSSGHRAVFESFGAVRALYDDLPAAFTAEDVTRATGGRRHMLVWHLAEHPSFDCRIVARQPLTARKGDGDTTGGSGED